MGDIHGLRFSPASHLERSVAITKYDDQFADRAWMGTAGAECADIIDCRPRILCSCEILEVSERLANQMAESHAAPDAAAESKPNKPATFRLVIRAKIISEETPPPVRPRSDRRTLALVAGSIAALLALSWIGVSVFRSDSPSTRTASEETRDMELHSPATIPVPRQAASAPVAEPPARPATSIAATASGTSIEGTSTEAKSPKLFESGTTAQSDASPTNEVIPDVPRSALQTIRGTIRVSIRVTVDKQGTVIAATSVDPGPSRYFERLAMEASRQWTFAPSGTREPRRVLVRFNFTREGTTARADSAH